MECIGGDIDARETFLMILDLDATAYYRGETFYVLLNEKNCECVGHNCCHIPKGTYNKKNYVEVLSQMSVARK